MRVIRDYLATFAACVSEPGVYIQLLGVKKQVALAFYSITFLWVTLLALIVWRVRDFPVMVDSARQTSQSLLREVPNTARFNFDGKTLTASGAALPLALHTDTFDLTLASESAVLMSDAGQPLVTKYSGFEAPSFSATVAQIHDIFIASLNELQNSITTILVLSFPVIWIGKMLFGLVTLIFYTFFGQIITWLMGVIIPFKKLYKLGLYILPIGVLIDTIAHGLFGMGISLTLAAYIGIVILIMVSMRSGKN